MMEQSSWLTGFLHQTEDEARRRGDRKVAAEHIALALARPSGAIDGLFATLGVDPLDWRDQIITVLGWREGGSAAREGRPAGAMADSAVDLRFRGDLETHAEVRHIVHLAQSEAAANSEDVGAAHVLVSLLLEGESVGAATGRWLGMTPGGVRFAAGLRNTRRLVADGAPATRSPSSEAAGPMLLCGGGTDADLLAQVVDLASKRSGGVRPEVVLVDLGWHTLRPTPNSRKRLLEAFTSAGAHAVDSGLTDRRDAESDEVCRRLASAELVWFGGGDAAGIYDRLWATPALRAIRERQAEGAVVGGVSAGAMVWGEGMLSDFASLGDPEPFPLFRWLDHLVVFAHYAPSRESAFRCRLQAFPGCSGVALAHGGAVTIDRGGVDISVLRHGAGGVPHVVLAGPDHPLTTIDN